MDIAVRPCQVHLNVAASWDEREAVFVWRSMNRELKFRAWSINHPSSALGPLMLEWDYIRTMPPYQWPERWVVMEFTGLLDRSDVEIYEGDILRAKLFR